MFPCNICVATNFDTEYAKQDVPIPRSMRALKIKTSAWADSSLRDLFRRLDSWGNRSSDSAPICSPRASENFGRPLGFCLLNVKASSTVRCDVGLSRNLDRTSEGVKSNSFESDFCNRSCLFRSSYTSAASCDGFSRWSVSRVILSQYSCNDANSCPKFLFASFRDMRSSFGPCLGSNSSSVIL